MTERQSNVDAGAAQSFASSIRVAAKDSSSRATMGGKPVLFRTAKTVINFKSGFGKKLLCDDLTFSTGDACQYQCSFCFVPAAMRKLTKMTEGEHMGTVIRRENALEVLKEQLLDSKGRAKFRNDGPKVIYASPLVDVAANMELVRETVEACKLILNYTSWHIRLLSKSNLLTKVADLLEAYSHAHVLRPRERVIYGFSTGTLNDDLAKAFEQGTPRVSKRIEALHQLQDAGYRTFGMICPSLPQDSYNAFAEEMAEALRPEKCEHVWAEVINVRGESMKRTVDALLDAGFEDESRRVVEVGLHKAAWEYYARLTFYGHVGHYRPGQLRFLQYVNNDNRAFWESQVENGAVLL